MTRPIHIHVEEPSMEAYIGELLPRLALDAICVRIINHGSKQILLREVPNRLRGYASIANEWRPLTLVLVDRDDDDCRALKNTLETAALAAGLATKTNEPNAPFDVVNRIVIEELEAWHFGDPVSLRNEYPGLSENLANKAQYRNPDAIAGGTHEALFRVLQKAGYYRGLSHLPKVDTARRMARRVDVESNLSASFQHFLAGLRALAAQLNEVEPNG